jgi:hypothetical protein
MADISSNSYNIMGKLSQASTMATRAMKVSGNQRFYQLIREVVASLDGAQSEDIDMLVDDCLRRVGEYFQASQVGPGQVIQGR